MFTTISHVFPQRCSIPQDERFRIVEFVDRRLHDISLECTAVEQQGDCLDAYHAVFSDGSYGVDRGAYLAPVDAFLAMPKATDWLRQQRAAAGPCLYVLPGVVVFGKHFGFIAVEFPRLLGARGQA